MNNNEEYVLLFTWRLVFPRLTDFIDPDTKLSQGKDRWAIYSLAYHIGGISSPEKFKIELCKNYELVENLKSRFGTDLELPKGTVGTLKRIDVERYGTTLNLYGPEIFGKIQQIPELSDFVKEFNARYSQAALADSLLVHTDPTPAAPVVAPAASSDPAPAEQVTAPAGFVPAVIQGEFAEIQGSVRDSKRETTLTVTKKTNEILERVDEKLERLVEVNEQTAQNTAKTARNTGTIAENTKIVSRETVERIEKMNGKDYRRFWQAEIQVPSMSNEEIWEWENPGRTLEGLNAEEKRQELTPIYTSLSRERSKKRKR